MKDLLILLILPVDSGEYKQAFKNFSETIIDDEDTVIILQWLLHSTKIIQTGMKPPEIVLDRLSKVNIFECAPDSYQISIIEQVFSDLISKGNAVQLKMVAELLDLFVKLVDIKAKDTVRQLFYVALCTRFYYGYLVGRSKGIENIDIAYHYSKLTIEQINDAVSKFFAQEIAQLPSYLPKILRDSFELLREFLWSNDLSIRLQARETCETCSIPLSLPHMISLAIDGIKTSEFSEKLLEEEKHDKKGPFLVIGATGCGKSTLINYLCGTQYLRKKHPKTLIPYLYPRENQGVAAARVGYGQSSQTLYPKLIKHVNGLAFVDLPGFGDNRSGNQKGCASLGVPLANHTLGYIQGIIIVLEYEMTNISSGGRGRQFRELAQNLSMFFSDSFYQQKEVPVFFVFTKLTEPDQFESFDSNLIRKSIPNRINELLKVYGEPHSEIDKKKQVLLENEAIYQDLEMRINALRQIIEFKDRDISHVSYKAYAVSSGSGIIGYTSAFLALIQKGQTEHSIETAVNSNLNKLNTKLNLSEDAKDKVSAVLKRAIKNSDPQHISEEIQRCIDEWKTESLKMGEKINQIQIELEGLVGQQMILTLINSSPNRIYIMRGHECKQTEDDDDDKMRLLKDLHEVNQKQCSNHPIPNIFKFSPNNPEFEYVTAWILKFITSNNFHLARLRNLPQDIQFHKEEIAYISKEIKTAEDSLTTYLDPTINKETKLNCLEGELNANLNLLEQQQKKSLDLIAQIRANEEEIEKIKKGPQFEYGSYAVIDKRNIVSAYFRVRTRIIYTFPNENHNIPIQRVEISLVTSEDKNRIYFKNPILISNVEGGTDTGLIAHDDQLSMHFVNDNPKILECKAVEPYLLSPGCYQISECDLSRGKLVVSYDSQFDVGTYYNTGADGIFAVRCFVNSEDLPSNSKTIQDFENDNSKKTGELGNVAVEKQKLKEKRKRLQTEQEVTNSGILNKEKIENIKKRLIELDIRPDNFIKKYLVRNSEEFEALLWVLNSANAPYLAQINYWKEDDFLKAGVDCLSPSTWKILVGESEEKIQQAKNSNKFNIPSDYRFNGLSQKKFFNSILELVQGRGLSIVSIVNLIKEAISNFDKRHINENSLSAKLKKSSDQLMFFDYLYHRLYNDFLNKHLYYEAFIVISDLLGMQNREDVRRFLDNYRFVRSQNIHIQFTKLEKRQESLLLNLINKNYSQEQCGLSADELREGLKESLSKKDSLFEQSNQTIDFEEKLIIKFPKNSLEYECICSDFANNIQENKEILIIKNPVNYLWEVQTCTISKQTSSEIPLMQISDSDGSLIEVSVPDDGDSLFYAIVFGYLYPVKSERMLLQERINKLFTIEESEQTDSVALNSKFDVLKSWLNNQQMHFNMNKNELSIINELMNYFRLKIVNYMRNYTDKFQKPEYTEEKLIFNNEMQTMALPRTWGGCREIDAISQMIDIPIFVYQKSQQNTINLITRYNNMGDVLPLSLLYTFSPKSSGEQQILNHYNVLIDPIDFPSIQHNMLRIVVSANTPLGDQLSTITNDKITNFDTNLIKKLVAEFIKQQTHVSSAQILANVGLMSQIKPQLYFENNSNQQHEDKNNISIDFKK